MSPPIPPPPSGPNADYPSPSALLNEAQAICAAETLLNVTQTLQQQADLVGTPEFGQKVLLRGELIQAIGQLPFKEFSPETQTQVITLLKKSQALDSQVEEILIRQKDLLSEHLQGAQTARGVQDRYQTNPVNSTRALEG